MAHWTIIAEGYAMVMVKKRHEKATKVGPMRIKTAREVPTAK